MTRPLHVLTSLAAMAHHGFELAAGVGLVFQPYLGLPGAGTLWGVGLPGWAWLAAARPGRWDRLLAALAGMSAGAALVHYTLWPVEVRRGVPLLVEAEGLRPQHLPTYNAILYAWAVVAAAALLSETPARARRWAIPGFVLPFVLRPNIRHHFEWLRTQAVSDPAWWNRALRASS
jgi:hypothetical protein